MQLRRNKTSTTSAPHRILQSTARSFSSYNSRTEQPPLDLRHCIVHPARLDPDFVAFCNKTSPWSIPNPRLLFLFFPYLSRLPRDSSGILFIIPRHIVGKLARQYCRRLNPSAFFYRIFLVGGFPFTCLHEIFGCNIRSHNDCAPCHYPSRRSIETAISFDRKTLAVVAYRKKPVKSSGS